jgi:metal-responsive CopG/Arc/MetJ family transcriptional regulator
MSERRYAAMGKQVIISITMPVELAALLDDAAERHGLNRSAYVRRLIEIELETGEGD